MKHYYNNADARQHKHFIVQGKCLWQQQHGCSGAHLRRLRAVLAVRLRRQRRTQRVNSVQSRPAGTIAMRRSTPMPVAVR